MATANVISNVFISFSSNEDPRDRLLKTNREHNQLTKNNNFLFSGDFLIPLNYYLAGMESLDKIMLPYMDDEKLKEKLRDLQITYLLLLAQKEYEQQHQKTENLKIYDKQLKRCVELIDALICAPTAEKEKTSKQEHVTEDSPVKYLSMFLGQWLATKIVETMDRKTKSIKDLIGVVNEKRLYWVWGSVIIKSIMELTPDDFFNIDQAKKSIRTPDPYTGTLSWGLYYFRFALNLGLLLKHTISGSWMSKEESETPWTERFQTQWAQRKFSLLNDSLWATCNIVCFFWLKGPGTLGALGDTYTIALLLFDLTVSVWDFAEQQTKFKTEVEEYERKMASKCERESNALKQAKKQCEKDWAQQNTSLRAAIFYAAGLTCSYILLCTPFFPAGSITTALNVSGAIICFVSSVVYNGIKGDLEVSKTKNNLEETKQSYQEKIAELRNLIKTNPNLEDNQKKFLFLELKQLQAETNYQKQTVFLQNIHLLRSVLFESLIPTLIFVNLVFVPISMNLSMFAAIIFLAATSYTLIELTFKTEKEQLTPFNETEYGDFCKSIQQNNKTLGLGGTNTLFKTDAGKDISEKLPANDESPAPK